MFFSCGALHFKNDSVSDIKKCCGFGVYLSHDTKYPKLLPLPNKLRNIAVKNIRHFFNLF